MIKTIMRDPMFLAQKSENTTEVDAQVLTDPLDTLRANLDHCVGMAANMIGVRKNIIAVAAGPFQFAMINPVITKKLRPYQTEEGCLSLEGVRPCTPQNPQYIIQKSNLYSQEKRMQQKNIFIH